MIKFLHVWICYMNIKGKVPDFGTCNFATLMLLEAMLRHGLNLLNQTFDIRCTSQYSQLFHQHDTKAIMQQGFFNRQLLDIYVYACTNSCKLKNNLWTYLTVCICITYIIAYTFPCFIHLPLCCQRFKNMTVLQSEYKHKSTD